MKEKNWNAQKPEWMDSQEFKDYVWNLKSNQERGFQKKLSQWREEKAGLETKYTTLKDYIGRVMADKNAIKYIAEKDPDWAREIIAMLPKDFFQTDWEEPITIVPTQYVNKEQIIQEYEQKQAKARSEDYINNLYSQFYDEFELTDEERTSFEKEVNTILAWETDPDRINKLFGYTKNEFKKNHLVDDVLASQKGNSNGMSSWMDMPTSDNGQPSQEMLDFFDSL
jgi:hypothetical protein